MSEIGILARFVLRSGGIGTREHRSRLRYFTSQLIHRYVNGIQIDTKKKTVEINPEYEKEVAILKELTWTYVIEAPGQSLQREGQRTVIRRLFEVYSEAAAASKKWKIFPAPSFFSYSLRCRGHRTSFQRMLADAIRLSTSQSRGPKLITTCQQYQSCAVRQPFSGRRTVLYFSSKSGAHLA